MTVNDRRSRPESASLGTSIITVIVARSCGARLMVESETVTENLSVELTSISIVS